VSPRTLWTSAILIGLSGPLLVSAVGAPSTGPGDAAADGPAVVGPVPAASAGWEYKVLPRPEIIETAPGHHGEYILPKDLLGDFNAGLQVLGEQGWELVAVEPYHTEGYVKWPAMYVFRRPK